MVHHGGAYGTSWSGMVQKCLVKNDRFFPTLNGDKIQRKVYFKIKFIIFIQFYRSNVRCAVFWDINMISTYYSTSPPSALPPFAMKYLLMIITHLCLRNMYTINLYTEFLSFFVNLVIISIRVFARICCNQLGCCLAMAFAFL